MRTTRQLSTTLPVATAEAVRERVRSGEYTSESEVIPLLDDAVAIIGTFYGGRDYEIILSE